MTKDTKVFGITNFNPVALFSLLLLGVGLCLGAVSIGLGQWARLDTDRVALEALDGATFKSQGLLSRCVSYDLTGDIRDLQLPLAEQPQDECVMMSSVNCSNSGLPLLSALDIFSIREVQNSFNQPECNEVKTNIQVSAAFMLLGVIATFVAMVLYFPLWHWAFYIAGAITAGLTVVCFAIGIGVFVDLDQSFAGFFSINGVEQEGCLSYGFGIALAAFIINILATVIGSVAICYRKAKPNREAVYLRK